MNYQFLEDGSIKLSLELGTNLFLPAENNGTPEWVAYLQWVEQGNTPEPAPEPPAPPAPLTTEQKLEAAGLTVAELRELFGLPAPE